MTAPAKQFVIYKDTASRFRWRLFAHNGRVIADSGESYKYREDCVDGARLVASIASDALIWDGVNEDWLD
ncbi:YegP family protein [Stenotrophomonas geniculata]|uniref:YegP family protein n=1 Tax=Stenotrophomonas TaxID=40323 RepID=UPI003D0EC292